MNPIDGVEVEDSARSRCSIRVSIGLLGNRQRVMLLLLTAGRIAVGFCDLSVAAAMYWLFLLLQGRPPGHHLWWTPKTVLSAALVTTILVVLRGLMDIATARAAFRQIQHLQTDFLLRLTDGYTQVRWERFVDWNRSELSGRALHTTRETADFYHRCAEIAANVVVVAVMTAALVYQSMAAACCLGVAMGLFYAGNRFLVRTKLQIAASRREVSVRSLQRNLADLFSSGKEIRTYGNQAFFQERIRRQAEQAAVNNLHVVFLPQFARIVADQGAILVFLFIVIAVEMRQGDLGRLLSLLVFYFVLSRRLLPLISQISFLASQIDGSYENVKIVDSELKKCRSSRAVELPIRLPDAGMVMQMIQVSFSYRGGTPILQGVNLYMEEGETVVLHGTSGIGKSSLLNLIAGVSQPLSGFVRVDRANVAYVPQEIPLLDDSIRNNLLFGLPQRSDEELMRALFVARLDEFVSAQPLGLDTGVGDNGALLSGGERQRLGLARAILRGGRLLLLDEATSALDEETERQVLENLSASGRAILLVTHRVQARSIGDRVFRLEEGSLVEEPGGQPSAVHSSLVSVLSN
jgi:ABC-type multidrug transport system fused ATPase/permease subunit